MALVKPMDFGTHFLGSNPCSATWLTKFLNPSEPLFPYLWNKDTNRTLLSPGLKWWLNALIYALLLEYAGSWQTLSLQRVAIVKTELFFPLCQLSPFMWLSLNLLSQVISFSPAKVILFKTLSKCNKRNFIQGRNMHSCYFPSESTHFLPRGKGAWDSRILQYFL